MGERILPHEQWNAVEAALDRAINTKDDAVEAVARAREVLDEIETHPLEGLPKDTAILLATAQFAISNLIAAHVTAQPVEAVTPAMIEAGAKAMGVPGHRNAIKAMYLAMRAAQQESGNKDLPLDAQDRSQ